MSPCHGLPSPPSPLPPLLPQLPGLPELHDRHVPAEPPGVPHLHGLPAQPGRGRLRHHEVSPAFNLNPSPVQSDLPSTLALTLTPLTVCSHHVRVSFARVHRLQNTGASGGGGTHLLSTLVVCSWPMLQLQVFTCVGGSREVGVPAQSFSHLLMM